MIKTKNRTINDGYVLEKNDHFTNETVAIPRGFFDWHKAKGFNVYDKNNNKWIDFTSGIFVANAGHSATGINRAIKKQVKQNLLFSYQYNTEIRSKFIQKLLNISPPHFSKTILTSSGSEATDTAYKLIKYWGNKHNKKYIISVLGNYHGHMLGSMLLANKAQWSAIEDSSIIQIPFPTNYLNLDALPPLDQIAAFFLETYQGWNAGFYPNSFITDLFQTAQKNNILMCFDEVQSGFFRLGSLYGYMTYGDIRPDLICVAKGLSSSLPLGAVLGTSQLIDIDETADLWGTHSGNSLCCAAGLANLQILTSTKFQKHLAEICPYFESECKNLTKYKNVVQINNRGILAAILFNTETEATYLVKECLKQGVLLVHTRRESVKLAPPLIITKEAIKEAFGVIEKCLQTMN